MTILIGILMCHVFMLKAAIKNRYLTIHFTYSAFYTFILLTLLTVHHSELYPTLSQRKWRHQMLPENILILLQPYCCPTTFPISPAELKFSENYRRREIIPPNINVGKLLVH